MRILSSNLTIGIIAMAIGSYFGEVTGDALILVGLITAISAFQKNPKKQVN